MRLGFEPPLDTRELLIISSVVSFVAWLGTFAAGFVLFELIPIGLLVILLTLGWVAITVGTVQYAKERTPDAITRTRVWRSWVWLSGLGLLVNVVAGGAITVGIGTSLAYNYGVLLPWLFVYGIGYARTAVYARDDARLSTPERAVYALLGVVSTALAVALTLMPTLHGPMLFALAVLSLAPLLTLYWR